MKHVGPLTLGEHVAWFLVLSLVVFLVYNALRVDSVAAAVVSLASSSSSPHAANTSVPARARGARRTRRLVRCMESSSFNLGSDRPLAGLGARLPPPA